MASVSIQNVSKAFGSSEVIHGVSLEVPDQAFVVLVGLLSLSRLPLQLFPDVNKPVLSIGEPMSSSSGPVPRCS